MSAPNQLAQPRSARQRRRGRSGAVNPPQNVQAVPRRAPRRAQSRQQPGAARVRANITVPVLYGEATSRYFTYALNPSGHSEWWARHAQLYSRFRLSGINIRWRPALSTFATGQVAVCFDSSGTAFPNEFQQVSQSTPSFVCSSHQGAALHVPASRLNRLPWYDCQDLGEDGTPGAICVAWTTISSTPTVQPSTAIGSLFLEMDLEFRDPTNQQAYFEPVLTLHSVTKESPTSTKYAFTNYTKRDLVFDSADDHTSYVLPADSPSVFTVGNGPVSGHTRSAIYAPPATGVAAALLGYVNANNGTEEFALESPPLVANITDPNHPEILPTTYALRDYTDPLSLRVASTVIKALKL